MNKAYHSRLSQRIAEEAQLLAEEKWIIDALQKLKQQRNSLQIERLHLENLKATINKEDLRNLMSSMDSAATQAGKAASLPAVSTQDNPVTASQDKDPVTVSQDNHSVAGTQEQNLDVPSTSLTLLEGPVAGIDDDMCNNEELNLAVTNSVFTTQDTAAYDIEEDDEDMENCEIDMNMFMYGQ